MSKKVWPKKKKSPMKKFTIKDFRKVFPNDDTCLDWIRNYRWPEYFECHKCDKRAKFYRVRKKKVFSCEHCGFQISPTAGTIFHKSSTPLTDWFYVIFLMSQTRGGISAKQIERELGVTYKTAWRMCKMIRLCLEEDFDMFNGEVEIDEAYFGGKKKGKRGRGSENKTAVLGIVQRQGKLEARTIPNSKSGPILSHVVSNVSKDAHIYTDDYAVYRALPSMGYAHDSIPHSKNVYVRGNVHTNTIEGFWSNCKTGISGVYHAVSSKYLQHYLNEYAFRYNHRNDVLPMFFSFLHRAITFSASSTSS